MQNIKTTKLRINQLDELGIKDLPSLFEYYPYRYDSIEYIPYKNWNINDQIIFEATIASKIKVNYYKKKKSLTTFEVINEDDTFKISIFNRPWLTNLKIGQKITILGKYEGYNKILASTLNTKPLLQQIGIKAIYSLKDKMNDQTFKKILLDNLDNYNPNNFIPFFLLNRYELLNKKDAIKIIHFPLNSSELSIAIKTLKYEEFLKFHLNILERKNINKKVDEHYCKNFDIRYVESLICKLPFKLTNSQLTVIKEVLNDLKSSKQMTRLIQGDVGSGKTIVAFISLYANFLSNHQGCLMAPTEILAKQHYDSIKKIFPNNVNIAYLHSSMSVKEKKNLLDLISNKQVDIIIGTHALFQNNVVFNDLGLIITDEQHRFGVKQRQALIAKGNYVDILSMSATPIPRTLANTLYGDIEVSTIDEVPNKGKTIHTTLLSQNSFISKIDEINNLLASGNQMYVVCAAIDNDNETLVRNVIDIYHNLSKYYEGKYKVGLLHGKLDDEIKETVIKQFENKEIDILVSTTVIEVGVDVKNANIMVIYDSNRFGLSQLHQLRGRVGRGDKEGYCYLLNGNNDEETLKRLNTIVKYNDGFKISEMDLKLRGPGDLLGFKQAGLPSFKIGNIIDDYELLNKVKTDAIEIYSNINQYPIIREYLSKVEKIIND